jgi:hypothetical protein
MCPRFVWAKVRPGDLVWCNMENGTGLYKTQDAGEVEKEADHVVDVPQKQACLCLALDDNVIMVLGPDGRYGWTHRLLWEVAGLDKQEWEMLGTTEMVT